MTKTRSVAATANDNSIPASRLVDASVDNDQISVTADISASKLTFSPVGTGAEARSVNDKLRDFQSVKDFGAVADGATNCTPAFEAALASLPSSGGTIFFPSGDYAINIALSNPNINIVGENGTILRPFSTSSVIDIQSGGENIIISNLTLTGQSLTNEGVLPPTNNTRGLHGLRILGGKKVYVQQVRSYGARYDGLYVRTEGDADLIFDKCEFGPTARNSVSIVNGNKMLFRDCTVKSNNDYKSSVGNQLYLFDIEPVGEETCKDFYFENCTFLGGSNISGSNNVILGSNLPDDTYFNCVFNGCYFRRAEGFTGSAPKIRPRFECRGLTVKNSVFDDQVLVQAGSAVFTVKDSSFEDIELGSPGFTFATIIGDGCFLKNISTTSSDPLSIFGATTNRVTLINVDDHADQNGKDLNVLGSISASESLEIGTFGQPASSQIGIMNVDGGASVTFTKGGNYSLGNSQVILTISGVATSRVFQTWEILISSQSTGTTQSRRQRSTKFAFMVTTGSLNTPVVDIIPGYGWADTLSSPPGGGNRDPGALNPSVTVNGAGEVEIKVDVTNTVSSGSNRINILALGSGSYINKTQVS